MKISDVLWRAQKLLRTDDPEGCEQLDPSPFTCDIIEDIAGDLTGAAMAFVHDMGCGAGLEEFDMFKQGFERQQARHTWLMFAYEIAVEENL